MEPNERKTSAGEKPSVGVVGAGGQLGRCLVRSLGASSRFRLAFAHDHASLDITDKTSVDRLFDGDVPRPDLLVNAAAYTAVDRCETERDAAMRVNRDGPGLLADACARAGTRMIQVSTDYVFDGCGTAPYRADQATAPRSVYGASKLAGERAVLAACASAILVRTSWVFGPGHNFVVAILKQAALRRSGEVSGALRVVDDQRGTPTYAADLAEGLLELGGLALAADSADENLSGAFHLTNSGETTWWDFARAILNQTGHSDLEIDRGSTDELDLPAERPRYSVLDCSRAAALGVQLRPWPEALSGYLAGPDRPELLESN